jgi:D-glycero-beta-D-manno-heptose 1-phosphate adenylyltransferase
MRVGALIKSYHSTQYLPLVLEQYRWVDKIVVLNYRFDTVKETTDDTREICYRFKHGGLVCESGQGLAQHNIHNRGLELLKDCDFAFISDADEILFPEDQQKILSRMQGWDYGCCNIVDYNGDLNHALPKRKGYTLVCVAVNQVKFHCIRSVQPTAREIVLPEVTMHHLGLVFPKHIIDWKADWEHKEEIQTKESLLNDWAVKRMVIPPKRLVDLVNKVFKKTRVYVHGVFDLLHYGHVQYLQKAKSLGDELIVGLITDNEVEKIKGYKPIMNYEQRYQVVKELKCVDYVVRQEDTDPTSNMKILESKGLGIDILCRGSDYQDVPQGTKFMEENGGKVVRIPYCHEISSTEIKNKILKEWKG